MSTTAPEMFCAATLHTGAGTGSYFNVAGVNPMLLEPLVDDPALRQTNLVFLHGDWPYARKLTALLTKPHAYLDFSDQDLYPAELAATIPQWMSAQRPARGGQTAPLRSRVGFDALPQACDSEPRPQGSGLLGRPPTPLRGARSQW